MAHQRPVAERSRPLGHQGEGQEGLPGGLCGSGAVARPGRMDAERLHLKITFAPPNRRARDLDNLLASLKSGLDGLCDVLGVDDSKWSIEISKADDRIGGFVEIDVNAA